MKKILIVVIVLLALLFGAFYALNSYIYNEKQGTGGEELTSAVVEHRNIEYTIDGKAVKLVDGVSEVEAAPGSASKIVTKYFGNEVKKDLDGDGREDVAFLLTQAPGGSGTFYYLVAALNTPDGYRGSEGFLLGDRIAPQTTESGFGRIVVANYADRATGEPMSVEPSIGKSVRLVLDPNTKRFSHAPENPEGEADPSMMQLNMKIWEWVKALYNDEREIKPKQAGKFTVTFSNEGRFSATTDCNTMSGSYMIKDDTISFGTIAATKKFCEGSQEGQFASLFQSAQGYHFTSRGELILDLKSDSGSVTFR